MRRTAEITLIENSTAGNPPKIFAGQTVEVTHKRDIIRTGVDGMTFPAHQPSTILWVEGTTTDLQNITDVKIIADNGEVLVDGELNTRHGVPHAVPEGVIFFVLKRD
jgi:hypothetical protein